jgi:hypothetical protein
MRILFIIIVIHVLFILLCRPVTTNDRYVDINSNKLLCYPDFLFLIYGPWITTMVTTGRTPEPVHQEPDKV